MYAWPTIIDQFETFALDALGVKKMKPLVSQEEVMVAAKPRRTASLA
ncbi:MAG: hypothetical protein HC859_16685 [Bacteroidia bacterium]|nr:hypothetical protein [Bacteroidia bacterium]